MEWYESEVQDLERLQQRTPAAPGCVLFYGGSSIRLWTTLKEDFPGVAVVNRGFGGSTMTACSWFFWRLVRPIQAKSLVLYAGDNDLGDGKSPIEVVRQFGFLRSQIDQFLGLIPFAFLSIKPSPARWHLKERIQETNSAIEKEITARPQGLYIDVFQPMLDAEGNPRRELFSEDGLHLSAAGYRLWREILWRYGNLLF